MKKITYAQLVKKRACKDQLDKFKKLFGEELILTKKMVNKYYKEFSLNWCIYRLLSIEELKQYEKVEKSAWDRYEKTREAALEQYEKVRKAAWEQYEKVRKPTWEQYEKTREAARKQYLKTMEPAWEQYEKTIWIAFYESYTGEEQ